MPVVPLARHTLLFMFHRCDTGLVAIVYEFHVTDVHFTVLAFVDMSDAVIWLTEYLQDEAKDREVDGRCAMEGDFPCIVSAFCHHV